MKDSGKHLSCDMKLLYAQSVVFIVAERVYRNEQMILSRKKSAPRLADK